MNNNDQTADSFVELPSFGQEEPASPMETEPAAPIQAVQEAQVIQIRATVDAYLRPIGGGPTHQARPIRIELKGQGGDWFSAQENGSWVVVQPSGGLISGELANVLPDMVEDVVDSAIWDTGLPLLEGVPREGRWTALLDNKAKGTPCDDFLLDPYAVTVSVDWVD